MKQPLKGRHALITGASSGIGAATARALALAGARVTILSEREEELHAVAQSIQEAGGQATPLVVDLSCPEQLQGLVGRVESQSGPLDVLINNAGVGLGAHILETKPSEMRFLFEVNFFALAELCRQSLASMSSRKRGHIINVSSAAGRFGSPTISAYSASKGAVHAYTQALRIEARVYGVSVSEVVPITVQTRFFDNAKGRKYAPQGVSLTPEAVARSIVRSASSPRPRPEILPYPLLRAVFIVNALSPGLLVRYAGRSYTQVVLQKLQQEGQDFRQN